MYCSRPTPGAAEPLKCDLAQYKAGPGLTASVDRDVLVVSWAGEGGTELRARYAIDAAQPVVRDLAIRKAGGRWAILGENLIPDYHVTSGIRRMSEQQAEPLRAAGVELTPEVIERNRWYAFWDAPLVVPGTPGRALGLPRKAEELRRATASFNTLTCSVKTDGGSLEVTFPGLSMGIFSGSLRFTAYRGANLIRMDAVARTDEAWIAYKYDAGLKGFTTQLMPRVTWHDTGGHVQSYQFGGVKNDTIVPLKAANR